jgi:hypothetical protein
VKTAAGRAPDDPILWRGPMKTLIIALAGVTALTAVAPAFAQTPYRQVRDPYADAQYQHDMDAYYAQQQQYQNQRGAYNARVDAYANDRAAYDARRAQYIRDRAAYDRRYGLGAYDRRYPDYYRTYSSSWDQRYPNSADRNGVNTSAQVPACRSNATAGGIIGALAGAALGSNVAARNARPEGAVLGAVVGGAIGANIGKNSANCDQTGYYYSYNQTMPYREAMDDRRGNSGQYNYSYYSQRNCRLAPAPAEYGGRTDMRYVRVCPDSQGRYRITG